MSMYRLVISDADDDNMPMTEFVESTVIDVLEHAVNAYRRGVEFERERARLEGREFVHPEFVLWPSGTTDIPEVSVIEFMVVWGPQQGTDLYYVERID